MKTKLFTILIFFLPLLGYGQMQNQYFDGADTSAWNSILVSIDTGAANIWQIGPPQKTIFDSAATFPNVIITDTINSYPISNNSSFQYEVTAWTNFAVLAIRWKQKLDMDYGKDGGIIEFSIDTGNTWRNAFTDPYVYDFFGFDTSNVDTLQTGAMAFTGTDSTWKDIWLCYHLSWLSNNGGSLLVRHRFVSDSVDNNREGWMIDNILAHINILHSVNEVRPQNYMTVSPNPTNGRINIATRKQNSFHIIENMELLNLQGKVMKRWRNCPTKFFIDISDQPNGVYFLNVKTNVKKETFQVVLKK